MPAEIALVSTDTIAHAADILRSGGLVGMPTETVYGLAADATSGKAIARLYDAKGRPRFNPLIAHICGVEMAEREVELSAMAHQLTETFWPGPLTLVLPAKKTGTVSDLARAGLRSLAIRCPEHTAARALIETLDRPIVAPSANRSGHVSPTNAQHVALDLGEKIDFILDAGPCERGIESTIIDLTSDTPRLLRAGAIATEHIEEIINRKLSHRSDIESINAPGQLKSHYAPAASVRLNAHEAKDNEAMLGFGDIQGDLNLSTRGDLIEAAANLFAMLRQLDTSHDKIAIAPIPTHGLGEAINDRLSRAAHRD